MRARAGRGLLRRGTASGGGDDGGTCRPPPLRLRADLQARGGDAYNYLFGGSGDDEIWGGEAGWAWDKDTKYEISGRGGDAYNKIYGGTGDDKLYGGEGGWAWDFTRGGDAVNKVYGGSGDDYMHGGAGGWAWAASRGGDVHSTLKGGSGDDTMRGGNSGFGWCAPLGTCAMPRTPPGSRPGALRSCRPPERALIAEYAPRPYRATRCRCREGLSRATSDFTDNMGVPTQGGDVTNVMHGGAGNDWMEGSDAGLAWCAPCALRAPLPGTHHHLPIAPICSDHARLDGLRRSFCLIARAQGQHVLR